MTEIAERLAEVQGRIEAACRETGRSVSEVTLVAVSKRQPDAALLAAYAASHRDFGENYVQELVRKQGLLPDDARFHLIGHLQTNKAKEAVHAALIHTVDREKVARALDRKVESGPLRVLIEVNLAGEAQKAGVAPEALSSLLYGLRDLPRLEVRGLMCIPPSGEGRRWFAELRRLAEEARTRTGWPLPELSMGMSADFEDAVREGATIVRVGTAIFGVRSA
ncbi:MAG: YggS family pyridoxal phosphate-dependent enzyme [Myxococcota bacterium]